MTQEEHSKDDPIRKLIEQEATHTRGMIYFFATVMFTVLVFGMRPLSVNAAGIALAAALFAGILFIQATVAHLIQTSSKKPKAKTDTSVPSPQ